MGTYGLRGSGELLDWLSGLIYGHVHPTSTFSPWGEQRPLTHSTRFDNEGDDSFISGVITGVIVC